MPGLRTTEVVVDVEAMEADEGVVATAGEEDMEVALVHQSFRIG